MPTIIVEDGTKIDNANSYVDVDFLAAYAEARGLAIPTGLNDQQIFLIRGWDYLQYRLAERGCEFDQIPTNLKRAQCQLVVEQQKRTLLYPKPVVSISEGYVTEKTVGPLTKKFAAGTSGRATVGRPVVISSVEVFLKSVLDSDSCSCGPNNWKYTVRV